ncbi:MAG: glycosyltransferase family 2 protein [Nitrospirae bacterium]|jgi:rhamnosyltransferase|nr:glycosyltransferase family 2 protein [Nitrospirota bacterium]
MNVSVIIPTLNADKTIGELLDRLLSQTLKPSEIILIDSSSEDNTVFTAKKRNINVISIDRKSFNHGRARNMAAEKTKSEILVFMTQDALPYDRNMLSNLIKPLSETKIAASYGRHIPYPDASLTEIFSRNFNYPETSFVKSFEDLNNMGIKTFFFSNSCSAIRRKEFIEAGKFPENVRANEDMILAANLLRKGYRIAYIPDAKIMHSHKYSLLSLFRRYYNIGSSLKKHKWILKHTTSEGEGLRFVRQQVIFIAGKGKYYYLPYILAEVIAKYSGYRLGLLLG